MKSIICFLTCVAVSLNSDSAFAGIIDVRFSDPNTSDNTFCVNVQVKAQDMPFELGSATLFFSYNTAAIHSPQYMPLNFNASNTCVANSSMAPYQNSFTAIESNIGEGNYAMLLLYPNQGCPTVSSDWIDVVQFCFAVADISADKNLVFDAQYTAFNTVANNGELHTIGTLTGLEGSTSVVMPVQSGNYIALTPNSSTSKVMLLFDLITPSEMQIEVADMLGSKVLVQQQTLSEGTHQIELNLPNIGSGYYVVHVQSKTDAWSGKVLLLK